MLKLLGKPFGKIGQRDGGCDGQDLSVPDVCTECRQLTVWGERILSWSSKKDGPFAHLVRAVLKADDDILKSLCGFCYLADESEMTPTQRCECLIVKAKSLGIPTQIPVSMTEFCDTIFDKDQILTCVSPFAFDPECFDVDTCFTERCPQDWLIDCGSSCEDCVPRELNPCDNAADLKLVETLIAAQQMRNRSSRSGASLLESLSILFPASMPQIVRASQGVIDVWIGRPMTPEEFQLRDYFKTLLPVNNVTTVRFVFEC